MLESDQIGDNVISVLARVRDQRAAVARILNRLAMADPAVRANALKGLLLLAGLRRLEGVIEQEASRMPLLDDIMDNKVLGREFRRGELAILLRQIEQRFGAVPSELRERLAAMSAAELESVGVVLLDARSLDELLPSL